MTERGLESEAREVRSVEGSRVDAAEARRGEKAGRRARLTDWMAEVSGPGGEKEITGLVSGDNRLGNKKQESFERSSGTRTGATTIKRRWSGEPG